MITITCVFKSLKVQVNLGQFFAHRPRQAVGLLISPSKPVWLVLRPVSTWSHWFPAAPPLGWVSRVRSPIATPWQPTRGSSLMPVFRSPISSGYLHIMQSHLHWGHLFQSRVVSFSKGLFLITIKDNFHGTNMSFILRFLLGPPKKGEHEPYRCGGVLYSEVE